MKKTITTLLLLCFLIAAAGSLHTTLLVSANPNGAFPPLSMPIEHINYTITQINGTLWAQIDGDYPITVLRQPNCTFSGELPMVYPMPPGSTNIHVSMNGQEIQWRNYTETFPGLTHHTAIGDWWMIYSPLTGISDSFELKIHYEHPLQQVNGSNLFLYDLNITPYLSPQSTNSTAIFTVHLETGATNIQVYTAPPDLASSDWKPLNYTQTQDGTTKTITVTMHSQYQDAQNYNLPGDLIVEFTGQNKTTEPTTWILPALLLIITALAVSIAVLVKTRKSVTSADRKIKKL